MKRDRENFFNNERININSIIRAIINNIRIRKNIFFIAMVFTLPILLAINNKNLINESNNLNRIDEIREKSTKVMPFDLDKTIHIFEKNNSGGFQKVIVKDMYNIDQLILVREHLKSITKDFSNGNFIAPASIHGSDMPGLSTLEDNPSKFKIKFFEVENGAKLEYYSTDDEIIKAIHLWFDSQVSDHGSDAINNTSNSFDSFSKEHICQIHPESCGK